jgi:hypothetical protein
MALLIDTIKDLVTLGKGKVFFKESGRNGYEDMLEVDDFKFNTSTEKVEKNTSRSATVVQIASIIKSIKVNGSFSCVAPGLEVMRFLGMADSVTAADQTSGTLAWVAYTAYLNRWINLNYVQLSSVKVRKATKLFDFTATEATDKINAAGHGLSNGATLYLSSATTLPAGLADGTKYYVVNKGTDDFEVALTAGGTKIDITDAGTGTHSAYAAYVLNTDYELLAEAGRLFAISGGGIADAESIAVSASYATQAMQEFLSATKTDIEGDLEFVGDAVAGMKQDFFANVKLSPEGDFSMIGEDLQKFQINFEVLVAEDSNGNQYYYKFRDRSGKSRTVAAV